MGLARTIGAAALAAVLAAPAPAAGAEAVYLRYDVYYLALRLLSIESRASLGDAHYWMELRLRTEGIVGRLFPWTSRAATSGLVEDGTLRPLRRTADSVYRARRRRVALEYHRDGAVTAYVDPAPEADGRPPVPPELRPHTIDPETATLAVIRRAAAGLPCAGTLRVFDGRLRYDLALADAGPATLAPEAGAPWAGPARLCDATIAPLAGFPTERGADEPSRLRYWLAPVLGDGVPAVPARLELSGARGTLHGYLAEARVVDEAAPPH